MIKNDNKIILSDPDHLAVREINGIYHKDITLNEITWSFLINQT